MRSTILLRPEALEGIEEYIAQAFPFDDSPSEELDKFYQLNHIDDMVAVDLGGRGESQLLDEFYKMGEGQGEKYSWMWYEVNRCIVSALERKDVEVDQAAIRWLGFVVAQAVCEWFKRKEEARKQVEADLKEPINAEAQP